MVNIVANRIPEHWRKLPLVNQPWVLSRKDFVWLESGKTDVLIHFPCLIHINDTLGGLLGRCGLSTPFSPFNQNCACTHQLFLKNFV